jgi:hypothetical protein
MEFSSLELGGLEKLTSCSVPDTQNLEQMLRLSLHVWANVFPSSFFPWARDMDMFRVHFFILRWAQLDLHDTVLFEGEAKS